MIDDDDDDDDDEVLTTCDRSMVTTDSVSPPTMPVTLDPAPTLPDTSLPLTSSSSEPPTSPAVSPRAGTTTERWDDRLQRGS